MLESSFEFMLLEIFPFTVLVFVLFFLFFFLYRETFINLINNQAHNATLDHIQMSWCQTKAEEEEEKEKSPNSCYSLVRNEMKRKKRWNEMCLMALKRSMTPEIVVVVSFFYLAGLMFFSVQNLHTKRDSVLK